ncbi:MAG: PP2C family protein-serine/threonine phosphatase [Salinivirgaceae bacterium]
MIKKLISLYQSFSQFIAGNADDFNVEQRLLNIALLFSILASMLSILINVQLQLPEALHYTISIGALLLIYMYISARIFKYFFVWPFIIIALLILSISWIFNEGPSGSINYIYILASVVFMSILPRDRRFWIGVVVFANLVVLYAINYFFPHWVHPYPSAQVRESDLLMTFSYVLLFSILIFSSVRKYYENERDVVEEQKLKIEHQHKNITNSIQYAKEIQQALFHSQDKIKKFYPDSFVFWQPKDVVSGDFYVFNKYGSNGDKILTAVADCTGHGVPGALITILGVSFINEIIVQYPDLSASEFLELLRQKVKTALQQSEPNSSLDKHHGIDLALIIYHPESNSLDYAGANRPIYLIRENQMVEFKPNRMPVGIHYNDDKKFTNHRIQLQKNDEVILFTDGFSDQFGGSASHKYYLSNLKKLLVSNAGKPMDEQLGLLQDVFEDWKGSNEQTDDVLIVGIRF